MSNEGSSESGIGASTDETLHQSLRTNDAPPPPAGATSTSLFGNLDTRGMQKDDWRLAQDIKHLADRGVTAKEVSAALTTCGLTESQAQKILNFAKLCQKAYGTKTPYAELAAELRIAYFFSHHYELDSDSYDVEERRPTNRNLLWRLKRLVEECEELNDVKPDELRASGFSMQDLFHRDARTIDGVVVYTRLDIARWLHGPHAEIRRPEEMKRALSKMDFDMNLDLDPSHSPSSQLNLAAWNILRTHRLFCVYEEHEHAKLEPHAHLTYVPLDGGGPIFLDFSFHQLFMKEKDGPKSPFVGTEADLTATAKTYKAQGRVVPLFEGHVRTPACANVSPEVITAIRRVLLGAEPPAPGTPLS